MTDNEIIKNIVENNNGAMTALAICDTLCIKFQFERKAAQIAIQRAIEDGVLNIDANWDLILPRGK